MFKFFEVSRANNKTISFFSFEHHCISWSFGGHIANGQVCISIIRMYTRGSTRIHASDRTWCVLFQHRASKLVNWKSWTMFFIHRKVRPLNYAIFQFCMCIAYFASFWFLIYFCNFNILSFFEINLLNLIEENEKI